jgi:hypothetical protein
MTICAKCKHCRPNYNFYGDDEALRWSNCGANVTTPAHDTTNPVTGEVWHHLAEYAYCRYVNTEGKCRDYEEGIPPSRPPEPKPEPEPKPLGMWARFFAYANSPASNTGPK